MFVRECCEYSLSINEQKRQKGCVDAQETPPPLPSLTPAMAIFDNTASPNLLKAENMP